MHPRTAASRFLSLPKKDIKALPSYEPDFLVDVDAINKRYRQREGDPRRAWTGTFQAPKSHQMSTFESVAKERCNRFIDSMKKRGWDLKSKLQIYGPFAAYDIRDRVLLLDMAEYRVRGIFQLDKPKVQRIEVPAGVVRRDPNQVISLTEALLAKR